MDFQTAVKTCLNKYADFNGRARRSEYWWFVLFGLIVSIIASILDNVLGTDFGSGNGLIGTIASLALLVPNLAVGARRLHDTGRSGWLQLLWIIPIIGWIILIVWFASDSKPGDNQYGPNPKTGAAGGYPPPPPPAYGSGQYNG
ncbi:DUF805 domain-containing protein [Nocardioides oleivorans]|uniref:DUF805 domain-containing protein n=1 Tax=Nocardioides oleivorans TaxID=273676 RepID=A0A4Q2RNK9_9ACTN|nr:DUF805 domain-containing protein [Nocardioides oleivorans]RYB90471.1 DUF805 domain-containing protein [Nocardioides oleivorans]